MSKPFTSVRKTSAPRRPPGRTLRLETLECRSLLAGDAYLINFQFDEVGTPARYQRDSGAVFGDRGNGLSYGWSVNHADVARARGVDPDLRLDTLIHFHAGATWELALANGLYEVTVAVGDPGNNDGVHTLNVEGVNFFDAVPDGDGAIVKTLPVMVADGRLTLDSGAALEKATRIDYIHVVGLPAGSNAAPLAPTITEPAADGQVVNPADVHMEAVGFSDPDGNLHKSSDWEIRTPAGVIVWQTLGIEGVERLHTHLGDGVFINSHAGRHELLPNADFELHVRFRDDAGAVSDYAVRAFHTGASSTTFPMQVLDVADSPPLSWQDSAGVDVELPSAIAIFSPGDPIIAIDAGGGSAYPLNETPQNAIDGTLNKYLNFGAIGSGFIVTPSRGPSVVTSFQITTANDFDVRDPASWLLFGTNSPIASVDNSAGNGEPWTLIDSGTLSLPSNRNALAPMVAVDNAAQYASYRMIFSGVKNPEAANSMQFAEIQFFGESSSASLPTLRLQSGATGEPLVQVSGAVAAGNHLTSFPGLADHAQVRVVIESGAAALALGSSDLQFTDDQGARRTVFLPAINLPAGQRLDLWVALDGATYYGNAAQTEADFSILARASDVVAAIPFTPQQPGYVVEAVAGGFQLPTNIAFVPNPGPNPSDPYFYVTELYGTIRVVSRDFTVSAYATGLLNFNPTGSFPGSGEQGLAGIVVDPATGDLFATRVTATDPAFPNGAHHPQVLRFTSADGGRTASTMSVIKDMPGETMGQSHQISNLTIGPDGLLYVHVGEGFDAARALDLNSYRGKILRMNFDGSAAADNPLYDAGDGVNARDYIFAYGFRNPFGGAWRAADGQHYEVENGPGSNDRLARVDRGASYGWNGSDGSMRVRALYNWGVPHAPVNITFVQPATFAGSQLPPGKQDHAFVSESGPTYGLGPQALGKRIVEFAFSASGGVQGGPTTLVEYTGTGRGTVVGLTAGPDGLYFTELYKDLDAATPIDAGARVFRVRYIGQTRGDYNWDGASDGADFLKWQQTLGSTSDLSADGNRDRIVGAGDLASWQNAFGGAGGSFETAALGAADSLAPPDAPAPAAIQDAALAALATAGAPRDAYRPPLGLTVPRTLPRPPVATATVRAAAFRERQSAVAGAVAPNAEIVSSTTAPSSPAQPAPEDDGSLPPALKRSTRAAYRPS